MVLMKTYKNVRFSNNIVIYEDEKLHPMNRMMKREDQKVGKLEQKSHNT